MGLLHSTSTPGWSYPMIICIWFSTYSCVERFLVNPAKKQNRLGISGVANYLVCLYASAQCPRVSIFVRKVIWSYSCSAFIFLRMQRELERGHQSQLQTFVHFWKKSGNELKTHWLKHMEMLRRKDLWLCGMRYKCIQMNVAAAALDLPW